MIRPFTVGRRNWLFNDTPKGADVSAIVYTMVEMAKAHGLNIYKYLNYLPEHLPETRMTDSEIPSTIKSGIKVLPYFKLPFIHL